MQWTKLDLVLVACAVLISLAVIVNRFSQHYQFESAARELADNIYSVAESVGKYHDKTGDWFPASNGSSGEMLVYPDPFNPGAKPYQGIPAEVLSRQNNAGLVMQLVRFQPESDSAFPVHLFEVSFRAGEPYLRILLDYGARGQAETEILMRVQERLPSGIVGEVDDHYFIVDLRRLINDSRP